MAEDAAISTGLKTCCRCRERKPLDSFNRNARKSDGMEYYCKACRKEMRVNKKDLINKRRREKYEIRKEPVLTRNKNWRLQNPEKLQQSRQKTYAKNKPIVLARNKKWRENNQATYQEGRQRYRALNKDKIKLSHARYYQENKDHILGMSRMGALRRIDDVRIYQKQYRQQPVQYDRFARHLTVEEHASRNDDGLLVVACAYCGQPFLPTYSQVANRIAALEGTNPRAADNRIYCGNECKRACPIYKQILYPKGFRDIGPREVQPELRKMVFERDEWTCQICSRKGGKLECHHITGVRQNPIESADMDNCITLCKEHHRWVHTQEGCRYFEMQCDGSTASGGGING